VIEKSESVSERLNNAADTLDEAGKDTTELRVIIDDYDSKVASAKEDWEQAKELWRNADSPEDVNEIAEQVNEYLTNAKEYLKDAREDLRSAVEEIKSQKSE
jgi:ABC-type transporter Mla subunit MlaD